MAKQTRGAHADDPAQRALRAAAECRDAAREAHEAIQEYKELRAAAAGLRAAIAEASTFLTEEVKRCLDAAGPVTQAERLLVKYATQAGEQVDARKPADQIPALPKREFTCPHCGIENKGYLGIAPPGGSSSMEPPKRGSVSVCGTCYETSLFDTDSATGVPPQAQPARSQRHVQRFDAQESDGGGRGNGVVANPPKL